MCGSCGKKYTPARKRQVPVVQEQPSSAQQIPTPPPSAPKGTQGPIAIPRYRKSFRRIRHR